MGHPPSFDLRESTRGSCPNGDVSIDWNDSGADRFPALDHNGFLRWTVSDGTVDLIMGGDFGIACASSGKCIDLDGSDQNAGVLTSRQILAVAGLDKPIYFVRFRI